MLIDQSGGGGWGGDGRTPGPYHDPRYQRAIRVVARNAAKAAVETMRQMVTAGEMDASWMPAVTMGGLSVAQAKSLCAHLTAIESKAGRRLNAADWILMGCDAVALDVLQVSIAELGKDSRLTDRERSKLDAMVDRVARSLRQFGIDVEEMIRRSREWRGEPDA